MPRILECGDLRSRFFTALLAKQYVVTGIRVERRVKIDEINAFVGYVLPKNVDVVSEVELVGPIFRHLASAEKLDARDT